MANRSSQIDTTLLIRAKDEGSKAIKAFGAALEDLVTSQKKAVSGAKGTASGLAATINALAGLDKAHSAIAGATERSAAAFGKQQAALATNRDRLRSFEAQLASARAAVEKMDATMAAPARAASTRYQGAAAEVKNLEAQIRGLGRTVAAQESKTTASASSLADLEHNTRAAGTAAAFARQQAERHTRALEQQARAASVLATVNRATGVNRAAATETGAGYTALDEMLKRDATAAKAVRDALNPALTVRRSYNDQIREAIRLYRSESLSAAELTKRIAQLRDAQRAAQARGTASGVFGLRPHELQNLSYQINDLVTQIASGTSATQALAQQGGQIIQIFPRAGAAIMGALTSPAVLSAGVAIGALALGISRLADNSAKLRAISAMLIGNADAADYTAAALLAATKQMAAFGISADDAMKVTRAAVTAGLPQGEILDFAKAAQGLSIRLGTDVPDAAGRLVSAIKGGFEGINDLNDATRLLTASELDSIRALFDQGRASEAVASASRILERELGKVADTAESETERSARQLTVAWNGLLDSFANMQIFADVNRGLADIAAGAARAIKQLRGVRDVADIDAEIEQARRNRADVAARAKAGGDIFGLGQMQVNEFDRRIAALQAERSAAEKAAGASAEQQAKGAKDRTAAAQREIDAARLQLAASEKITSQAKLRAAVNADRARLNNEAATRFPVSKGFTDAMRAEWVEPQLKRLTDGYQDQLSGHFKQVAADAKRAADEVKRLAQQTRFIDPVNGRVSSGFGQRAAPKAGASRFHRGVDIAVPVGTDVRAPADGVVIETGYDSKLGKFVYIDHGNNTVSKFGHLSENSIVGEQQQVRQGQTIARSGNTGNSTGPHLHYEVVVNGKPVDPRKGIFPEDGAARFKVDLADAVADADKLAAKQDEYLAALDLANAARERDTVQLGIQSKLTGTALLAAQRQAEIEDAIAKAREDAAKIGIAPDDARLQERLAAITASTGARFDAAHAGDTLEAQRRSVDQPVQDLTALRDSLMQRITNFEETGQSGLADKLLPQLGEVNAELMEAVRLAKLFYDGISGDPEALVQLGLTDDQLKVIGLNLESVTKGAERLHSVMGITGQRIRDTFADNGVNAIGEFSEAVASGSNAFTSLGQAFIRFAATFFQQISAMIARQLLFNLISGVLSSAAGGATGGATGSTGAMAGVRAHDGGVIGDASTYGGKTGVVPVLPKWFHNMTRYHTGGIIGLAPNEVPVIAEEGEEMLTRDDPRHVLNGGAAPSGGGGEPRIKNIVVFNEADAFEAALNTTVGEKAFFAFVNRNSRRLKGILG